MKKAILLFMAVTAALLTLAQPPTITSFSPDSGPVGTTVTITGTNFSPVAENNTVYFGAVRATVTAATATSLTVTVPAGATYRPITVTPNGLTAYSAKPFVLTFPNSSAGFSSNAFAPKVDFATGGQPFSGALGDFNTDGKTDLSVVNFMPGTVSILRNESLIGTVAFAGKDDFRVGRDPTGIATGDLDGDGKLDIVAANLRSFTVTAFRNASLEGNISFAYGVDFVTGSGVGYDPFSVAIGDLDGDGRPELAVVNTGSSTVSVFRNTSTVGNISFAPNIDYGTGSSPQDVAIGDLDGDGRPELAVTNLASNSVSLFRNVSTVGSINFGSRIDFPTGSRPFYIALGDLDGDNKLELALANEGSNAVSVFRNLSTRGVIAFAPKVDFMTGEAPRGVAIGDLDGDGKPDLAVGNFISSTVSLFQNLSTSGVIAFAPKVDFITGSSPYTVAIGDLDGDGKPDISVVNAGSNSVSVLRNKLCEPTFLNNGTIVRNPSCGKNDGALYIVPTSGTAPFQYSKDGGQAYVSGPNAGYTFQNLAAGTYQLRMKDANGCESEVVQKTISAVDCPPSCTPPTFLNNGMIVKNATCGRSDGELYVIPTSGTAPFLYSKDGGTTYVSGPSSGYTFSGLAAGTYELRMKDASGCESDVVAKEVKSPDCPTTCTPPTLLNNSMIVGHASCGGNDGSLYLIPTSGTAPYQYSINGGATYVSGPDNGYTFQNLAAGSYQLRIKDASGCESAVVEKEILALYGTCATASVKVAKPQAAESNAYILAYPNPSKGQFRVQLTGLASQNAQVQVLNAQGAVVETRSVNISGSNTLDFNLSGKAKGLYLIKVVSEKGTQVAKVVVQ